MADQFYWVNKTSGKPETKLQTYRAETDVYYKHILINKHAIHYKSPAYGRAQDVKWTLYQKSEEYWNEISSNLDSWTVQSEQFARSIRPCHTHIGIPSDVSDDEEFTVRSFLKFMGSSCIPQSDDKTLRSYLNAEKTIKSYFAEHFLL